MLSQPSNHTIAPNVELIASSECELEAYTTVVVMVQEKEAFELRRTTGGSTFCALLKVTSGYEQRRLSTCTILLCRELKKNLKAMVQLLR